MENRRKHERHRVWFPMTLYTEDSSEEGFAISYDVSSSGLLMACPGRLDPGTRVRIRIHPPDAEEPEEVEGEILRVSENDPDNIAGPWRYQMAVRFSKPVPWLETLLEHANKRE